MRRHFSCPVSSRAGRTNSKFLAINELWLAVSREGHADALARGYFFGAGRIGILPSSILLSASPATSRTDGSSSSSSLVSTGMSSAEIVESA